MNPESSTPPLSRNADQASFIGLAKIMRMIFSGIDLAPLGTQLVARAEANSGNTDANAFMDLFTILLLRGNRELALSMQAQALELQQIYSVPSITGQASIRLLVLMGAGDLMANSPVELLLENSDVALDMLYCGGAFAEQLMEGARRAGMPAAAVARFESNAQIAHALGESLRVGDVVLLKGSRVQRMEEILQALLGAGKRAS